LAGLGSAWRAAHQVWHLPVIVGEALMAMAAIVWALLLLLFILRWILAREESLGEAHHPLQRCFIGLAGVSTMLIAFAAQPYSKIAADILFGVGAAFTLGFALWRTGLLWRGNRDDTGALSANGGRRLRHGGGRRHARLSRLGAACVRLRRVPGNAAPHLKGPFTAAGRPGNASAGCPGLTGARNHFI
jgi:hypothetical protein